MSFLQISALGYLCLGLSSSGSALIIRILTVYFRIWVAGENQKRMETYLGSGADIYDQFQSVTCKETDLLDVTAWTFWTLVRGNWEEISRHSWPPWSKIRYRQVENKKQQTEPLLWEWCCDYTNGEEQGLLSKPQPWILSGIMYMISSWFVSACSPFKASLCIQCSTSVLAGPTWLGSCPSASFIFHLLHFLSHAKLLLLWRPLQLFFSSHWKVLLSNSTCLAWPYQPGQNSNAISLLKLSTVELPSTALPYIFPFEHTLLCTFLSY